MSEIIKKIIALKGAERKILVGDIMERSFRTASADEDLDAALGRLEPGQANLLPVMWNRQLVGLLTAENVGEFYMIRRALAEGAGRRPPAIRYPRVLPPPLLVRPSHSQSSAWPGPLWMKTRIVATFAVASNR